MLNQFTSRWAFPDLRRQIDRAFEQVLENGNNVSLGTTPFPALNVWEDQNCLFVEAELPGVSMNEIEINVVGGELSIKGKRQRDAEKFSSGMVTFHRQERPMGEFSRSLTLPDAIDTEKVEAFLKDGVLTIKLPKAEAAKPRRIQVHASN